MRNSSIIDNNLEYCYFCGKYAHGVHHLIFGSSRREKADEDGIYVPICDQCHIVTSARIHDNPTAERLSKCFGQAMWELELVSAGYSKEEARSHFIKRYGRNYI